MKTHAYILQLAMACSAPAFAAEYTKPSGYRIPELRIRADSRDALNMPPATYFAPADALFLDNQDIVTRFSVYLGESVEGLLRWSDTHGLSTHFATENTYASGLSYSRDTKEILFEQVNYGYFSEGIMALDTLLGGFRRAFFDASLQFMGSPQSAPLSGGVIVREKKEDSSQGLSLLRHGLPRVELVTSSSRNLSSPYSYLFPITSQTNGRIAMKVRQGPAGAIADERPDEIILVDLSAPESSRVNVRLQDRDSDPNSLFRAFDNFGALDEAGNIAWVATLASGRRALVLKEFGARSARVLVTEELGTIHRLSSFHINMNSQGSIVFRATDSSAREGVWHVDFQAKLTPILIQGDRVKTDHGAARVGAGGYSVFASPQINRTGDILVAAFLTTEDAEARDIGLGYFVISPETP